jgi:NADH-quinone oxidoreductase subunit N
MCVRFRLPLVPIRVYIPPVAERLGTYLSGSVGGFDPRPAGMLSLMLMFILLATALSSSLDRLAPIAVALAGAFALNTPEVVGLAGHALTARSSLVAATLFAAAAFMAMPLHSRPIGFTALATSMALGGALTASAADMVTAFLTVELQSLMLYALAASNRDDLQSVTAGVVYALYGGVASAVLLFAMALLHAGAGHSLLLAPTPAGAGAILLAVLALLMKLGAAPAHQWSVTVYSMTSTWTAGWLSTVPKPALAALLLGLVQATALASGNAALVDCAVLSLALGAIQGLPVATINRLLAWSGVHHLGYFVLALAADASDALVVYAVVYTLGSLWTWAVLIVMRMQANRDLNLVTDLQAGPLAIALALAMLSLSGLPPLVGFFGKLVVVAASLNAGMVALAVIAMVFSSVSTIYYLRITIRASGIMAAESPVSAVVAYGTTRGLLASASYVAAALTIVGSLVALDFAL